MWISRVTGSAYSCFKSTNANTVPGDRTGFFNGVNVCTASVSGTLQTDLSGYLVYYIHDELVLEDREELIDESLCP
jgi:hypothetical protein